MDLIWDENCKYCHNVLELHVLLTILKTQETVKFIFFVAIVLELGWGYISSTVLNNASTLFFLKISTFGNSADKLSTCIHLAGKLRSAIFMIPGGRVINLGNISPWKLYQIWYVASVVEVN